MHELFQTIPDLQPFADEISALPADTQNTLKQIILILQNQINYHSYEYERIKNQNQKINEKCNKLKGENLEMRIKLENFEKSEMKTLKEQTISNNHFLTDQITENNILIQYYDHNTEKTTDNHHYEPDSSIETIDTYTIGSQTKKYNDLVHSKKRDDSSFTENDARSTNIYNPQSVIVNLENTISDLIETNNSLKVENSRLSKEINYILESDKDNPHVISKYLKDYFEVVDLLKNNCKISEKLKIENIKLKGKLEIQNFKEKNLQKEIEEKCSKIKSSYSELKIIKNEMKKELEKILDENDKNKVKNEENMSKIHFIEIENYHLKFKNKILSDLEKTLDNKNLEIQLLNHKIENVQDELYRFKELIKEKEKIINNIILNEPMKLTIVEYQRIMRNVRNKIFNLKESIRNVMDQIIIVRNMYIFENEKLKSYEREISLLTEQIKKIKQVNGEVESFLKLKNDKICELVKEREELKNKIMNFTKEMEHVNYEKESLRQEMCKLQINHQNSFAENQPELYRLIELERNELKNEIEKQKMKINQLEQYKYIDIEELKTNYDRIENQNIELKNKMEQMNNKYEKLQNTNNYVQLEYENLEKKNLNALNQIKFLQSEIQKNNNTLLHTRSNLASQDDKDYNQEKEIQNNQSQNEVVELQRSNENLKSTIRNMQFEYKKKENEFAKYKKESEAYINEQNIKNRSVEQLNNVPLNTSDIQIYTSQLISLIESFLNIKLENYQQLIDKIKEILNTNSQLEEEIKYKEKSIHNLRNVVIKLKNVNDKLVNESSITSR